MFSAQPAMAVESVTCQSGETEPHAGRQFTLSARPDPLIGDFTYKWDLDNDGSFETDTGTEGTVKTEKKTAGTYTFAVQVTDKEVPENDPKRQATGKCDVKIVNAKPFPYFEMHPVEANFATAYEAVRFTFSASDEEDDVNQVGSKHAIDFDGDGQFEFTATGNGEVYVSFPAGFDKDVTHRVTDAAGESVDTKLHVKTAMGPFGIGGTGLIVPVALGTLPKVAVKAPSSIKRKTLLKGGLSMTFSWGPTWGRADVYPTIKKTTGFTYKAAAGYAPGQKLTLKPLPPSLKTLIKKGAKKIVLHWLAEGTDRKEQTGTITVKIKR